MSIMDVIPFKGYRYNADIVDDPGLCIAPPYDVIDPDHQKQLYQRDQHNIVRIIKGVSQPDDNGQSNVYSRAAEAFDGFISTEALKQDSAESIYVYVQEFTIGQSTYRRSGFIALGKLESYGGSIKPHEQTLAGPKADRLNLMQATHSQFGQIFMLYDEPDMTIDAILANACQGQQLLTHTDDEGVIHSLYAIEDSTQLATITEVMRDKSVFIADGHHRYETAFKYHELTQSPGAAYCMMTFVNTHNEGLVVLPTHRLLKNIVGFNINDFIGLLRGQFDIAQLAFSDIVAKKARRQEMLDAMALDFEKGQHTFGMYFADDAFYVATLRESGAMDAVAGDHSAAWRGLDVAILHKLILEKLLGIDEAALKAQSNLEYVKDFGQATLLAIDQVDEGNAQGLFFLNTTTPSQVEAVALAGEKMPQKSTFFYPKIFSGLVINRVEQPHKSVSNCNCIKV